MHEYTLGLGLIIRCNLAGSGVVDLSKMLLGGTGYFY